MRPRPRLRTAKRFSSSRFSDVILADNILLASSWRDQRSSTDIVSRSTFFIDMLSLPFPDFDSLVSYYLVNYFACGQPATFFHGSLLRNIQRKICVVLK